MSDEAPEVSVVIPLYDKAATVGRAVRSVLTQTSRDFEVIVINDGSTDEGPGIVKRVGDARVKVIEQERAGVSAARNRGVAEARADLVAFLDADDEWSPRFLETVTALWRKYPHCDVFATRYRFNMRDRGRTYERHPVIRGVPPEPWEGVLEDYFSVAVRSDPPVCSSAVAARRPALMEIGGFPAGVDLGEDILTWARLAARNGVAYSSSVCAVWWKDVSEGHRHLRLPRTPDVVSRGLSLLAEGPGGAGLVWRRRYLALWHRMRGCIFLELGHPREAGREFRRVLALCPASPRLVALVALSVMPRGVQPPLLLAGRSLLRRFRQAQ
jgi:cellulose synthase/poly-beta-1,6-N-acetylglucosamine synthase-like glycosyltransferase